MMHVSSIAHRDLLFSPKDKQSREKLRVAVSAPVLVDKTHTGVQLDAGSAVCTIIFQGLGVANVDVHGADSLHALAQACDVDRYLRGMSKKFDFFWPNGEPYFDDSPS